MNLFKRVFIISNKVRIGIINTLFWIFLIVLGIVIFSGNVDVPTGSTLVVRPSGDIYDSPVNSDIQDFIVNDGEIPQNTLLREIILSLNYAIDDRSIDKIVLDLDYLGYIGYGSIEEIGYLLEKLKNSGKEILTYATFYSQEAYYLASYSDFIGMDPFGEVYFNGIGVYRNYYKDLLDKYNVDVNIFRAGEYKSYVEPYLEREMTPGTKAQNLLWMNSIWDSLTKTISDNREEINNLSEILNGKEILLGKSGGSFSKMALETGLVDKLLTPDEFYNTLGETYFFTDYLEEKSGFSIRDKVAVVTIEGAITYSDNSPGSVSAVDIISILDSVETDNSYSALILRINSGGGGVYASEIIRRRVEQLTQTIPVVISMGDVCASGGYWIATAGDYVFAENKTITGSIGVFGINLGFQETLKDHLGVINDGVGTMYNSGDNSIFRNLSSRSAKEYQLSVEETYRSFLNIISKSREIPIGSVEDIAGGRVWSGSQAKSFSLVDDIGGIIAATNYLESSYDISGGLEFIDGEKSFIQEIAGALFQGVSFPWGISQDITKDITKEVDLLNRIDDPKGLYSIWY